MGLRDGFSDNKLLDNFGSGRSNPNEEQLSTRVGCGQVHRIIENDLDECRVVAPNLPTKTDDLSHSTGHGWTTREKVVNGQFLANAVSLITRHDCERTSGYATSWENSIRHYRRLHVSMILHQDRLRRVRQMLTRPRYRLYAYSITRERLVDLDKEYGMKRW
uniref:Ulp1 protease-like n=2 Tax=Oryza sativa subsp. japonica TaxID=39947 RepID=Q53PY8_ORYSJ|nr:hypothetical protein LOC_Os11g05250 [Oryza sativa Japonica Group]ABA91498.1 hypothetical protein LOC_Os11g05250 [Oryza sativa Japonica Group]